MKRVKRAKLKSILGFCQCKGCRKRYDCEVELTFHVKGGGTRTQNLRLCIEHAKELCQGGEIKSLTYHETIDFESK